MIDGADETDQDEHETDQDEEHEPEDEVELESVDAQASRVQAQMFTNDRQATERARQNGHGQNGHGQNGHAPSNGQSANGAAEPRKPKKTPMAPAFMKEHPLFPQEPDAPPRENEFVWIDIARLAPDGGELEHHPRRFSAGELQSWQDIYEICGGGHYRLTATNSRSRFVAFHPAKPSEFHTIGGEPRPFNTESPVKKVVRPGVLPTASEAAAAASSAPPPPAQGMSQKELAAMIAETVSAAIAARFPPAPVAPPPPAPTTGLAEAVTALGSVATSITQAIMSRPAPVPQDMMTPMLKMMEMSSNERVAMITASKDKADPTAEMLKVMLQMREKPMTAAELITLMKSSKDDKQMSPMDWINFAKEMRGGDKGGLKDTIETIQAVQKIAPQGGGTSELGEVAGLFGTLMKATEKGEGAAPAAAPAQAPQKPQTALLIPGMGMVTNPSAALIKRMEDVAAGHAQPGVLAPPAPPAAIVQAPAAPPAPPPQAAPVPPVVAPKALPSLAPPSDEDMRLEAALEAALEADAAGTPLSPEAASLSPEDYFAHKIKTDPEFSRRVQEKLQGVQQTQVPHPEVPPPPPPAPPAPAAAPVSVAAVLTADDVMARIQSDPMFLRQVHDKMNQAVAQTQAAVQAPSPAQEAPAEASPGLSLSGEMIQEVARHSPEIVDGLIAQAVGPEQAKETSGFAEALASLPEEARPYLRHAFPADGLKAAQEGRLR